MYNQLFRYAHQTDTNTVSICNAQTWLETISHAFHSSTHIHLPPTLIHQLDNPCIVNHSGVHIKQPQILLAFTGHKHGLKQ
jgi:hypothetical protein